MVAADFLSMNKKIEKLDYLNKACVLAVQHVHTNFV